MPFTCIHDGFAVRILNKKRHYAETTKFWVARVWSSMLSSAEQRTFPLRESVFGTPLLAFELYLEDTELGLNDRDMFGITPS